MFSDEPFRDPCQGQTEIKISAYLRGLDIGDEVIVRDVTSNHIRFYKAAIVGFVGRGNSMLRVEHYDPGDSLWWVKSGRSTGYPMGKHQLVMPTRPVLAYIKQFGEGSDPRSHRRYLVIPKG